MKKLALVLFVLNVSVLSAQDLDKAAIVNKLADIMNYVYPEKTRLCVI